MPDAVTMLARVATATLPDAPELQREIDDRMARIPTRWMTWTEGRKKFLLERLWRIDSARSRSSNQTGWKPMS